MKYSFEEMLSDVLPELFYIKKKKIYLNSKHFGTKALKKFSTSVDEPNGIILKHPSDLFVFYFNIKDNNLFGIFEAFEYKYKDIPDDFYKVIFMYSIHIYPTMERNFDLEALKRRITIESIVDE